jgi:hypothetical protein
MEGSQKLNTAFTNMNNFIKDSLNNKLKNFENTHQNAVEERHKLLDEIARQKEIIRKREEEERMKIIKE